MNGCARGWKGRTFCRDVLGIHFCKGWAAGTSCSSSWLSGIVEDLGRKNVVRITMASGEKYRTISTASEPNPFCSGLPLPSTAVTVNAPPFSTFKFFFLKTMADLFQKEPPQCPYPPWWTGIPAHRQINSKDHPEIDYLRRARADIKIERGLQHFDIVQERVHTVVARLGHGERHWCEVQAEKKRNEGDRTRV